MNKFSWSYLLRRSLIALLLITALAACGGDDKKDEDSGKNTAASEATLSVDQAQVELRQGETWTPVSEAAQVRASDAVRTDANGQAVITFYTGTQVEILPNSEIVVEAFEPVEGGGTTITLNQLTGETLHRVELVANSGSQYEVNTPVAHLTVRGTEFTVAVADDGATRVEVTVGVVQAEIGEQTVEVQPGEAIDVAPDETTT
ncbi:MAG: FecR domain-containing protein, partial [Chloroflexi bacterium]|nr:FecR domain-containing protein [Chloroflexota bacterium]